MSTKPVLDTFLQALPAPFERSLSVSLELTEPFVQLVSRFSDEPGTVALLSGGGHDSARYDILGLRPWLSIRERAGTVSAEFEGKTAVAALDPFAALESLMARYGLPGAETSAPLSSGLLGYLAYDLKDVLESLPRTSRDDLALPRLYMTAPSILVVHDRREKTARIHIPIRDGEEGASRKLSEFLQELKGSAPVRDRNAKAGALVSGLSRDEYMRSVDAIREYIARGHVYQVNMSQRFETDFDGDAFALFADLFEANPAPFFAYLNAGDHRIVSTSPERFIELRGTKVETRPIKGTRPRGKTPEDDLAFRRDLETSFKDDSELSMIVDLLRNDIGKVCAAGTVKVVEHKRVEAYENVYHLVSVVEGELDKDKNAVDLIRATFPGGSITGCPKIRSMEVIDELEPVRRHLYTGSIGYLGFQGTMDFSIAIRTATITPGRLVYSVGGGVVYDSKPDDEYEETLHKGRTISNALERMGKGTATASDKRLGWIDGKFKPMSEMTVSVEEEGFAYGYGFFETLRVQNGRILRLESHIERFRKAWVEYFGSEFPDVTWKDVIDLLVTKNDLERGVAAVKLLASAGKPGSGDRGIRMMATVRPYVHRLAGKPRQGLRLSSYPQCRQSPLSDHKTMNYLLQRMAAKSALANGADEAVLLNADSSVSETNTANLLCRIDGKFVRPRSEHVLPGTMEQAVCDLLASWGSPVETRKISLEELKGAQAVWITNALMGAVGVTEIDGAPIALDEDLCGRINKELLG
ncbi:MAG: aminodeoxychorismate synthase component I [Fibrobacterota bacterium]|nr:aminodeoxychorismate synthase component I [Fibrobacterota bacterium]QQS06577.1 MAG: aminodeoxychorismate synthase component I [Fibrobacterota bacterium]